MSYLNDDFSKWCDQWDQANKKGLFDDAPKHHVPSAQTAGADFFGMRKLGHEEAIKDVDAKYWSDLYKQSRDYGSQDVDDYLSGDLMQEETAVAKKQAVPPNPVKVSTFGKDQDAASVGAHYDVGDFKGLEALKVKLHGLLDKLNGSEGLGQGSKLESQIQALEKQIDELSNSIGHTKNESHKK